MSPTSIPGRRVYPDERGHLRLAPGDYGRDMAGAWWARPPHPEMHMGSLTCHTVTEHADGTITVSPSLMIDDELQAWHGFLEAGMWRPC